MQLVQTGRVVVASRGWGREGRLQRHRTFWEAMGMFIIFIVQLVSNGSHSISIASVSWKGNQGINKPIN